MQLLGVVAHEPSHGVLQVLHWIDAKTSAGLHER